MFFCVGVTNNAFHGNEFQPAPAARLPGPKGPFPSARFTAPLSGSALHILGRIHESNGSAGDAATAQLVTPLRYGLVFQQVQHENPPPAYVHLTDSRRHESTRTSQISDHLSSIEIREPLVLDFKSPRRAEAAPPDSLNYK